MTPNTLISTNQQQFITTALESGIRIDGRTLHIYRNTQINIVNANTVEINHDNTIVLCTVQCNIITPIPERPNDGTLHITCNYSTTNTTQYTDIQYNKNSTDIVMLERTLQRIYRESNILDTESLCILSGKKVWSISLYCTVLNNNGNIIDTCIISIMAGLLLCRRNEVTVIGEQITIHALDDRTPVALTLYHIVIPVTYSIINSTYIVCDPNLLEEQISDSTLTVVLNNNNDLCYLHKPGGCLLSTLQLLSTVNAAVQHTTERMQQIRDTVYEYVQQSVNKYKASTTKPIDVFGSMPVKIG